MKIVDLSHVMNVHTPGWVGYAGNKMYYAQNLQTQGILAQRIETALHVGTHFDGAMHATDGRSGDMASLPPVTSAVLPSSPRSIAYLPRAIHLCTNDRRQVPRGGQARCLQRRAALAASPNASIDTSSASRQARMRQGQLSRPS